MGRGIRRLSDLRGSGQAPTATRPEETEALRAAQREFALCDAAIALLVVLGGTGAVVGAVLVFSRFV